MAESKGLKRERDTVRPRSARRRRRGDDDWYDDEYDEGGDRPRRRRSRRGRGRTSVASEVRDLNRGGTYVAAETLAIGLDVTSRVLRGVVDRAFDEDYSEPGDVVRGLTNEADLAVYDLVDELRKVPRRLERRFEEGIHSPRAERGERDRRSDD